MNDNSAQYDVPIPEESEGLEDLTEEATPEGPQVRPSDVFLGREFGGYRVEREVALGGMATVFLAHKAGLGGFAQPAALKVIHPHLAQDRDFIDMFLDEARIASCINHPNVCRVFDFGNAEGTYYLAMEYLMGETWAEVLAALRRSGDGRHILPAVTAYVLGQACEGLHAAHEALDPSGKPLHIVHRDVSPQNIFVGYDGSVRVLDFGIASAAERLHTTRNGAIKGRFSYMAPEQMKGETIDRRADVWSMGVVLRESLTGTRLFRRETDAETILAVTQTPIPAWEGKVDPALRRVADAALQRDRSLRYETARELGAELNRYSVSQEVPVGMPEMNAWMERMFAARINRKRKALRDAARGARGQAPMDPSEASALTIETPEAKGTDGTGAQAHRRAGPIPSVSAVRPVTPGSARPRGTAARRLAPWLVIATAVGMAALLAWPAPDVREATAPRQPDSRTTPPRALPRRTTVTTTPALDGPPSVELGATKPPPADTQVAKMPDLAPRTRPAVAVPSEATPAPAAPPPAAAPTPPATPATREASLPRPAPPPREERARRPVRRKPGTVNVVTTNGWAEVYVGKRRLGTTPGSFRIPAGRHTLRLKPFGKGRSQTEQVTVRPGKTTKLKVQLR